MTRSIAFVRFIPHSPASFKGARAPPAPLVFETSLRINPQAGGAVDTEQTVIEVFELIAHRPIQLKSGPWNYDTVDIADAQLLLEPRLHVLGKEVEELHKQHGIDRSVLISLRAAEAIRRCLKSTDVPARRHGPK